MGCIQSRDIDERHTKTVRFADPNLKRVELEPELDIISILQQATYEDTDPFTIKDSSGWAKVIKEYDGDTCHIAYIYRGELIRLSCRLYGIDCAELKSDDPIEVEHAKLAKSRLNELCNLNENGLIWVHIIKQEKYGRFLTKFYADPFEQDSFSDILIQEGLGYEYYGLKKKEFYEWYQGGNESIES